MDRIEILYSSLDIRNMARPLDAADLLADAADTIRNAHEEHAPLYGGIQPFIVSDIVIDLHTGSATIYIIWQDLPEPKE